jgi:hypothetical protein
VYTFTVTNNGNYTDTFDLGLAGYTWSTQLSTSSTGPLWIGDSATFTVGVDVPGFGLEYVYGSDTFQLSVASSWPPHPVAVLAGTTQATADLAVSVVPASASGGGAAGEVVAYTLTVTNTGQYQDDYTLSVSSLWTAQLSTLTLSDLAPLASATVVLSVTVPIDANSGDADTATVTVQSDTDATVTAQAQATTTAQGYAIFLPVVMRND